MRSRIWFPVAKYLLITASLLGASVGLAANEDRVALPGHVLPFLSKAKLLPVQKSDSTPITLTVVLKRTDQKGFDAYLREVYDPASPNHLDFLDPIEVANRFGPSQEDYEAVSLFFIANGLSTVATSSNRLVLTISGMRAQAETATATQIHDYSLGRKSFFAVESEPSFPPSVSQKLDAVIGLSSPPMPEKLFGEWGKERYQEIAGFVEQVRSEGLFAPIIRQLGKITAYLDQISASRNSSRGSQPSQVVGVTAFDRFRQSDIQNYFELVDLPDPTKRISEVSVAGGATLGEGQVEVVLDTTVILASAPDARVAVYHAPLGLAASFQLLFNAMVNDGVDVISNSWGYCEDQTTLADVQSIESVLMAAAASGISVFSASGDTGSTCLNGSPLTATVPASAPTITAVGGTTLAYANAFLFDEETWWDGSLETPQTGRGGYGVSRYFVRPEYQDGIPALDMRSIPDVVIRADPRGGTLLCIEDKGGCPTKSFYGGTSMSAPFWASITAILNARYGQNLGFLNPVLYGLAGSTAFRDAQSMGSDFERVGLGSPNANELLRLLEGGTLSSADVLQSEAFATVPTSASIAGQKFVPADGDTAGGIAVIVRDSSGYPLSGVSVSIGQSASSSAQINPAVTITNQANGAAFFEITNLEAELVEFEVIVDGGLTLSHRPVLDFSVPPASSAGIAALSSTVEADGTPTTVTVTLRDALDRPTPGKLVQLFQNDGARSRIESPSPAVTDANGEVSFTVSNEFNETVTYTAIDVTDGDLPVPGSAVVEYINADGLACRGEPPTAAAGYDLQPFVTEVPSGSLSFGGINFGGCAGATGMAFDDSGDFYVASLFNGNIYKTGPAGGVADGTTLLSDVLGPAVTGLTFGADGKLYASRSGNVNQDVVEVDPTTGALLRDDVGSVSLCAFGIATDPLSGDLFLGDFCGIGGSRDIFRVSDPGGSSPVTSVYVTTPAPDLVNGQIAFAPDGTLFFRNGGGYLVRVAGTDQPSPDLTRFDVSNPNPFGNFGMAIGAVDQNGAAISLIGNGAPDPDYGDPQDGMTALYRLDQDPTSVTTHLINGQALGNLIGPDGCLYMALWDAVYRLTNDDGTCPLRALNPDPEIVVTPTIATPNPTQGDDQVVTARIINAAAPEGTAVIFAVNGANADFRLARTDADGVATATYTGINAGLDFVTASAELGGQQLSSNRARITWETGDSTSFLTLNGSALSALEGSCTTVRASLSDISADPVLDIEGATIDFAMGGKMCSALTDADGVATCSMRTLSAGTYELTAAYAGSGEFRPASDARAFQILEDVNRGVVFETGFGLCPDGR